MGGRGDHCGLISVVLFFFMNLFIIFIFHQITDQITNQKTKKNKQFINIY